MNTFKSIVILIVIAILHCSTHERNNPFDPQGTIWEPPLVTAMEDTVVAVFDSFYIHASAVDGNGVVGKYIWALDGTSFLDTTTAGKIKVAFQQAGSQVVKVKVASTSGVISFASEIAIDVHSYAPTAKVPEAFSAGLDDTLTINATGYDTNGSVLQYDWEAGKKSLKNSATNNTLKINFYKNGIDTISLKVLDEDGNYSPTYKIIVTIKPAVYTTFNSGLPSNNISSIAIDSNSHWTGIFIGTSDKGLAYFNNNVWTIYNSSNSNLPSDIISSIKIDNRGYVWVGTSAGLAKLDGGMWTIYNSSNSGLPDDHITSIAIPNFPDPWVGTWGGLAKFNGTSWTTYTASNSSLPEGRVSSIAIDGSYVWVGTSTGGLAKFDGTSWKIFNKNNSGLPDNEIRTVTTDLYGYKWIGTAQGLAMFNGTIWEIYTAANSGIPDNSITIVAHFGSKWIGTSRVGITIFDYERNLWPTRYDTKSELPSNNITSIIRDKQNFKWIGTSNGLAKIGDQ